MAFDTGEERGGKWKCNSQGYVSVLHIGFCLKAKLTSKASSSSSTVTPGFNMHELFIFCYYIVVCFMYTSGKCVLCPEEQNADVSVT